MFTSVLKLVKMLVEVGVPLRKRVSLVSCQSGAFARLNPVNSSRKTPVACACRPGAAPASKEKMKSARDDLRRVQSPSFIGIVAAEPSATKQRCDTPLAAIWVTQRVHYQRTGINLETRRTTVEADSH